MDKEKPTIKALDFNISVDECFHELKPHPKFNICTFENYNHDERYPSQLYLKNILRDITLTPKYIAKKGFFPFMSKPKHKKISDNLYIDGTYGVGKTHLLSACFHAFNGSKAFMSFVELTYFINYYSLEKTIEHFKNIDLLLIDEFDLDDPATTRMVARLIDAINKETVIITTSNRLPKELGGGNFDTEMFGRELGIISDSFKTIVVEGVSFRINMANWQMNFSSQGFIDTYNNTLSFNRKLLTNNNELFNTLRNHHPFRFFVIPKNFDAIFIDNFTPFTLLDDALRFTAFIDTCYYYDTKIFFNNKDCSNYELFTKDMMETAFERRFLRCRSRIDEIGMFFQ